MAENAHLRKLLLIQDNNGQLSEDIDSRLREGETLLRTSLEPIRADCMPREVRAEIQARQVVKAEEKRVS